MLALKPRLLPGPEIGNRLKETVRLYRVLAIQQKRGRENLGL
jgi:hypothetical protein